MKLKHAINLHKGLTAPFVVALMLLYQNFSLGPWIYLTLHGTYGLLWLIKDRIYPDKQWEAEISPGKALLTFGALGLYWLAPYLLISSRVVPPLPLVAAAIALNLWGVFLHYVSDAQKYYTLKYHAGLITEGFFARCRNTNYLGELLIYGSFALLSLHWLPFAILTVFFLAVFLPNMRRKDQSLSRYPEFVAYREQSGLLIPRLFGSSQQPTSATANQTMPLE
jgi:steroid 5-alpha reductase family enzyme